jgi:hypothetical protein
MAGDGNGWWWGNMFCLPVNVNSYSLLLTLQKSRAGLMKFFKIRLCHCCKNMNSDVIQQWRTHMHLFQQGRDSIVWLNCCQWKQGKQESLNHYRIITNIADQKAYRSGHTTSIRQVFWRGNVMQQWRTAQLSQFFNINNPNELNWVQCKSDTPAGCKGFELKNEPWQRVNPIWIND